MQKREAAFTTRFSHWVRENIKESSAFELKYVKGGTFNVKQWVQKQPNQARGLLSANTDKGCWHKISDMSAGAKPFDAIYFINSPAYLVIYWEKYNDFTMTAIQNLLPYFDKSITYDEANEKRNS